MPSTLPAILAAYRSAVATGNVIVLPGALEALAVFDDDEAWERSAAAMARVRGSADAKEGVQAFVEKRPAQWSGR